jgi:deoxyribodipyrimidine photo-lyase
MVRPVTDVFVFTRDLRVHDNEGLREAIRFAKLNEGSVKCLFIFRDDQIGKSNSFRSDNAIAFMIESLVDLQGQLREYGGTLSFIHESTDHSKLRTAISKLTSVKRIHISNDYTPYASKREKGLRKYLLDLDVDIFTYNNHILSPESLTIRTASTDSMYQTFAPFYNGVRKKGIPLPQSIGVTRQMCSRLGLLSKRRIIGETSLRTVISHLPKERLSPSRIVSGGREQGLRTLRTVARRIKSSYKTQRHRLDYKTSSMSAYHHFGCVSPRETWVAFSHVPALQRQLVWRDYAYHMMVAWPDTWDTIQQVGSKKAGIPWKRNRAAENAWKEGRTGVPAVDAAMRQLHQEGYIHNRGRMVVANYLIKNLMIDWRVGEQHFAKWLTDYDRAVNFMNWIQIAAVLPTDQPTRTMNPYIQARKNDPELTYIRTYIPELKDADDSLIFSQERDSPIKDEDGKNIYPSPIVSYDTSRKEYAAWARKYLVPYKPTKAS